MSLCATLSGYRVSPGTRVPPARADRARTRYKPLGRIESTDLYSPKGRGYRPLAWLIDCLALILAG